MNETLKEKAKPKCRRRLNKCHGLRRRRERVRVSRVEVEKQDERTWCRVKRKPKKGESQT